MRTAAVLLLALLIGCAKGSFASIQTIQDDFRGGAIHRLTLNTLESDQPLTSARIAIGPQITETPNGSRSYSLMVEYRSEDWAFIESGQSLSLIVDGETHLLSGPGSRGGVREVRYGGRVEEMAWYTVSPDFIRTIAEAPEVRVRLDGRRYYFERHFGPTNFQNFRDFVAAHMSDVPDARPPK